MDQREYTSLTCSYIELVPSLYSNVTSESVVRIGCPGTKGPKGEKFGCSGTATIVFEFEEARKGERTAVRVEQQMDTLHGLVAKTLLPLPNETAKAMAMLDNIVG